MSEKESSEKRMQNLKNREYNIFLAINYIKMFFCVTLADVSLCGHSISVKCLLKSIGGIVIS